MRLTQNVLWNAAGVVLPISVGILVVPMTVRGLGTERFGTLSIMWMLIGYFSIFDLGLGRTLTKLAARLRTEGPEAEVAPLAVTTLLLVLYGSALMSLVLALSAGWLAQHVLGVSSALQAESTLALIFVAASLPFVLASTVLSGLLEAYQCFAVINLVRVPLGVLMLATPLLVLHFSTHLGVITAALAVLRVINAAAFGLMAVRAVPLLREQPWRLRRDLVPELVAFGGWLTVSNIVGPLMLYFDRFVIAGTLGSADVAYYTVPYDLLNRVLVIPTAIQGVLFPAFVTLRSQNSPRVLSVFQRSSESTMLLMAVPLLATMLLAYQGLDLWMGPEFAQRSAAVAQILMIGVVANAMARTPFVLVQGAGHARWTALLHLAELPIYALALWMLLQAGAGIEGVACVWTGRMILDTALVYLMAVRVEPRLRPIAWRDLRWFLAALVLIGALQYTVDDLAMRVAAMVVVLIVCGALLLGMLGVHPFLLKRNT